MGKLTDQQRSGLREFLERQGLSFKPLQDEMVDHMSCDLEDRMAQGLSFEEAWDQSVTAIPNHHFQNIQQEIMETINKRFTWSQVLSFSALGLIAISTIFKILHLNGADEGLLLSFGAMAASLVTGSLSGIFLNKEKKGTTRLLAIIAGILLLLIAFSFKLLHLTGADELVLLAVTVLVISVVVNTLYVYQHASGEGNLLTYLHEKHTPGIERFFLFLFVPLLIYKMTSIVTGTVEFIGNLFVLVLVLGAGIQFIVLNWRVMEQNLARRNLRTLVALIVCSLCLILPFLGPLLSLPVRVGLIVLFSPVAGWLAYTMDDETSKPVSIILACLVSVVFLGWGLITAGVLPRSYSDLFFNIPILLVLSGGVVVCRKQGTMRTYMLVSVGGYLLEYIL